MAEQKVFIDIQKKEYINSILNKIFKSARPLQVWQKEEPLRQKTNGVVKNLNLSKELITLESDDVDGFIDFKTDEIYFYSEYRTTIFKSKIKFKNDGKTIIIEFPEIVKIEEARMQPRTRYGLNTQHRVDVLFEFSDGRKVIQSDVRVLDSSEDGCAILVSKHFGEYLSRGGKLIIMDASLMNLRKRAGMVRSISTFKNILSGESCYRLGIGLITGK